MPLARINNKLLHFVHIPKTGGCSVTDYMRKKGKLALHSRTRVEWSATTPQHMESGASEIMIPNGFADETFAVIRDPVQRLLSEYRYRAMRHQAAFPKEGSPISVGARTVELDWEESFHGTFDQWVSAVFRKYAMEACACDNHIRPQRDFIRPDLKLFSFERGLDIVFDWIDRVTDTTHLQVPLDKNVSKKFAITISKDTRGLIEEFYRADYELIHSLNREADRGLIAI